ncbi:uncharacterized protein LOC100878389 [Megachile rotundata]|uniref:uncharacterized protein LOC100878389 n=1 Tax=Megachile rotundata TaxID=143995 RepID=UPI003FCF145B
MSLQLETNKWTPKLIIVFQLTIWCVVGIILLQKGAISLRDKMKSRNDTADVQEKLERWEEKESIRKSTNVTENRRHVTKVNRIGVRRTNAVADNLDDVTSSNERLPRKLHSSRRTHHIGQETSKKTTIGVRQEHDTRGPRATQTLIVPSNKNNEPKIINYEKNVIVSLASDEGSYISENIINNTTPSVSFELKRIGSADAATSNERNSLEHRADDIISYETKIGNSKNETKPRRSPVNRIGAAIAIIMLAIGIIMLLLGPFIVIIRALGNRRRTREMAHKKWNRNDQPPTYEEATLMDQAPRYSTLQLNMILESSSL